MSLDATIWAWRQAAIRPTTKLVLLSFADRADADFRSWPSCGLLTRDTNLDRKTILRAIDEMKRCGLIADTGERRGKTRSVIVYQLVGPRHRHQSLPEADASGPEDGMASDRGSGPENGVKQSRKRDDSLNEIEPPKESITEDPIPVVPFPKSPAPPTAGETPPKSSGTNPRTQRTTSRATSTPPMSPATPPGAERTHPRAGTRLDDHPEREPGPANWLAWAAGRRPDLDAHDTWLEFWNYWTALPGPRARKLDWHKTWQNCVINRRKTHGPSRPGIDWHDPNW